MTPQELWKPVITPYELYVALAHGVEWTGDYVSDVARLLPMFAEARLKAPPQGEPEGRFVTAVRPVTHYSDPPRHPAARRPPTLAHQRPSCDARPQPLWRGICPLAGDGAADISVVSGALIRSSGGVVSNYAAAHLALRGYRGLDAAIGQTPVGTIEQGRRGIAANYATLGAPADRAALGGTAAVDAGLAHVAARGSESASASGATAVSAVASNVEILRAKVRVVDPDPARASAAEVAGAESDTDPQASPSAVVEFLEFLDDVG